jgi:SAM-dependent methyltransferase
MSNKKPSIIDLNYRIYDNDPGRDLSNPENVRLHETWFREDTANFWRHARMMEPVFKCMLYAREDKWLTIGDGHYGIDSIQMKRRGYKHVLPTDITETLLRISKDRGLIDDYRLENAEALSFPDEEFDYVLCKESYHHFPRPMMALYEMLRVARKGVVLIEPQDQHADHPLTAGRPIAGYEPIGNYIYTISRRELEKVALGLDLPAVAFKNIFDIYFDGVEYVGANENEPLFVSLVNQVKAAEERSRQMQQKHNVLLAVIFKERPNQAVVDSFLRQAEGWEIISFPGNPYIPR